jgi:hypothetical protein
MLLQLLICRFYSALQMEGFRSLDENEEVEFVVSLGRNGLEAADVHGVDGTALRGHSIRPMGRKSREKLIRSVVNVS